MQCAEQVPSTPVEFERGLSLEAAANSAFFVYGTLKQGQIRGGVWPFPPSQIVPAVIQADLYDLGPYPAAAHGSGWILGELWFFEPFQVATTIQVLDAIEGFEENGTNNEYDREIVNVFASGLDSESEVKAHAYFAARTDQLARFRRIPPFLQFLGRNVAVWPDTMTRVPKSPERQSKT